MKINSKDLFNYVNNLETFKEVKFKVFYDDNYVTEILWNGSEFEWESGTFTSGAFFNELYDFIVEDKEEEFEEFESYVANVGAVNNFRDIEDYVHLLFDQQAQLIRNQNKIIERLKNDR